METSGTARIRARQAGVLMFGKALATVSEAVVPLIIIRLLAKNEVGILSGVLIVYSTAALVLSSGFPGAVFFFLPTRSRPDRGAVARKMASLLATLGTVLAALMWSVGHFAPPEALGDVSKTFDASTLSLLSALALYPLGELPSRLLPNLLVIEERTRAAAAFGIFKALGLAAATLVPILLGASLREVLYSVGFFGLLLGVVLLVALGWLYPAKPQHQRTPSVRELARFSVPLGLTDVAALLNNRLDRFLIGLSFSESRFAEYHAAAFQIPVVTDIPYSVGRVYAADFVRLFKEDRPREAIEQWRTSIRKVSLLVVPISCVFVVASEEFIELAFTADYLTAANVFRMYALLMMGRVAAFGSVIVAAGKPQLVVRAALVGLVSNVALSVPCLYLFGFVGPALGTALAFIPTVVYYCHCIAKASGLNFKEIFPLVSYLKTVGLAAIAMSPALAFKLLVDTSPALKLLAIATLGLAGFGLLGTWAKQITSEDWRFVRRYLRGRMSSA